MHELPREVIDAVIAEGIPALIAAAATFGAAWITVRERRESRRDRALADEVRRLLWERLESQLTPPPPASGSPPGSSSGDSGSPGEATTPTPAPTGAPCSSPNEMSSSDNASE